jgi:hypothetical protein
LRCQLLHRNRLLHPFRCQLLHLRRLPNPRLRPSPR